MQIRKHQLNQLVGRMLQVLLQITMYGTHHPLFAITNAMLTDIMRSQCMKQCMRNLQGKRRTSWMKAAHALHLYIKHHGLKKKENIGLNLHKICSDQSDLSFRFQKVIQNTLP